jgi:hypothetical protein
VTCTVAVPLDTLLALAPLRIAEVTVMVDPETALTCPATTPPKPPKPPAPPRRPDGAPVGRAPLGRLPVGRAPLGRAPSGRIVQLPFDAVLMRTFVAVIDFGGVVAVECDDDAPEPPDGRAATATTHDPLVTAANETAFCTVNTVDEVHVTAVCVLVFCTCMVVPLICAISPDVPGPP